MCFSHRSLVFLCVVNPEVLILNWFVSCRYKDQEAVASELQRPQRPDIIEREVVGKSPPPREEHHPPLPLHHPHEQPSVVGVDSEMPEHYDLENASSIAPSDIDIVYHYKGTYCFVHRSILNNVVFD